jgi:hypothetical protein
VFKSDPLTLGEFATLPKSSLSLAWFEGAGQVYIGRPFVAGGSLSRVSNPRFDWAVSKKEFRTIAKEFANA